MKKTITFIIACLIGAMAYAQSTAAVELADRIAQRMKDTLDLSSAHKDSIYAINLLLHSRKLAARQQYAGTDSVGKYIQKVEYTRDSLYQAVLTSEKYLLYLQKKKNLISNN